MATLSEKSLQTPQSDLEIFNKYLRYTDPENILKLAPVGIKRITVSSDTQKIEIAVRFDYRQILPLIDPAVFTYDFLSRIYLIVGISLFEYLPLNILSDYILMLKLFNIDGDLKILYSFPENIRVNPEIMLKCVTIEKISYHITSGNARYSYIILLASIIDKSTGFIINNHVIYIISKYLNSCYEPEFLKFLELIAKNSNEYTLDKAFLLSIKDSKRLTIKYSKIPEYVSFFTRLYHDILYYNQMCIFELGCYISKRTKTGSLHLLSSHNKYHLKQFIRLIFEYLDCFSYGDEISMRTLLIIGKHLDVKIIVDIL